MKTNRPKPFNSTISLNDLEGVKIKKTYVDWDFLNKWIFFSISLSYTNLEVGAKSGCGMLLSSN